MNTLQYILEALQALVSYLKKASSTGLVILPEKLKNLLLWSSCLVYLARANIVLMEYQARLKVVYFYSFESSEYSHKLKLLFVSLYRWKNWCLERLNKLHKVILAKGTRTRIEIQRDWLQSVCCYSSATLSLQEKRNTGVKGLLKVTALQQCKEN